VGVKLDGLVTDVYVCKYTNATWQYI